MVRTVFYPPDRIEISRRETFARLGYGAETPDADVLGMIEAAERELKACAVFAACYLRTPVTVGSGFVTLADIRLESQKLAAAMDGCREAFVFAATAGAGADRLIAKKAVSSKALSLIADAVASSAVESLCDRLNRDLCEGLSAVRRFSPGYGDLPLTCQPAILNLLNAKSKIGLGLTDSLLMTPSKSVTAIIGIKG